MRAIVVRELGGPEAMVLAEHPDPVPGPGQVLVQVAAAGVNFIDIYRRSGVYPQPVPYVPGSEGAGTVLAVGEGVTEFSAGDHVAWAEGPGSYAEQVAVDARQAVPVPEGVDLKAAAAVMLQGLTAHYLCHSTYPVTEGTVAVVHAAAGGVGLLLTQMIKGTGRHRDRHHVVHREGRARQAGRRRLRDHLRGLPRRGPRGDRRPGRGRRLRRRGQGHLRREPVGAAPARHDGPVRRVERPGTRRSTRSGSTAAAPCSLPAPLSATTSPTAPSCCGAPATSSGGSARAS